MKKAKPGLRSREAASRASTGRAYGSSGIRRSDYVDAADYARALREAGGPGPDEFYSVSASSPDGALVAATLGANRHELNGTLLAEAKREQAMRPHVFLRKR